MSERNTGYQFVSTDTEAVESLLISIYEKITGVSVKPASPEKLFIQFVAAVVIQERGLNNYTGNQNIPSRAEGENLDALAELFYVTQRPAAQAAVCTERFHISEAQTTAILIPAGTRVTDASGTLTWETVADAYVSIGETYADVQIRCQTATQWDRSTPSLTCSTTVSAAKTSPPAMTAQTRPLTTSSMS